MPRPARAEPAPPHARANRRAPTPLPPRAGTVLLIVDAINPLDFDGAEDLAAPALAAASRIAAYKRRAAAQGVPAIYVNDHFGDWRADFPSLVERCRRRGGAAAELLRRIAPLRRDHTLVKPRHSAFYATPLQLLLTQMQAQRLVLTGFAADLCLMFTAMDAFERGYTLWVPRDATAAESPQRLEQALAWMALALHAQTAPTRP